MVSIVARRQAVAQRRALAHDDHAVLLRPFVPARAGAETSAMIVRRKDQDFIARMLADLAAPGGVAKLQLADDRVDYKFRSGAAGDGALKLFQPVHRVFNLVVLEAVCERPGQPRLDPRKIDSAGFVLRRRSGTGWQAWLQGADGLRGWVASDAHVGGDADPDPARRPASRSAGHPEINRQLVLRKPFDHAAEQVTPMFVAPPDVCAAAGRTILYGIVPVTSHEQSETGAAPVRYGEDADERNAIREHLSHYLKQGSGFALPRAGLALSAGWADESAVKAEQTQAESGGDVARLGHFIVLLNQLAIEFGAFGESAEARALFTVLNELRLPLREEVRLLRRGWQMLPALVVIETIAAGDFLKTAADVLVGRGDGDGQIMPLRWPTLDAAYAERLLDALLACLSARYRALKPQAGRFDNADARYAVRAFIRVRRDDGCAPQLVWTARASEAFAIAPWYDSAGAPPVQIALPDASDRAFLKKLKPNVAFALPPSLMNLLQANDAKALADGDGKSGGAFGVGWICSFSIPIITLCAFICLNIFLKLFDIIFSWMMFIKICIPYPKKGGD